MFIFEIVFMGVYDPSVVNGKSQLAQLATKVT